MTNERSTQWDANSLFQVCYLNMLAITVHSDMYFGWNLFVKNNLYFSNWWKGFIKLVGLLKSWRVVNIKIFLNCYFLSTIFELMQAKRVVNLTTSKWDVNKIDGVAVHIFMAPEDAKRFFAELMMTQLTKGFSTCKIVKRKI